MNYPTLTLGKILAAIEREPTIPCDIFMGAIEWNLWENPKSLARLSAQFKCKSDLMTVYTEIHNRLFSGIAMPMGQYNSYIFLP